MKIIDLIKKPRLIIFQIGVRGWIRFFSDETYLKIMYWARFGKKLNLKSPITFNEKMQWLKLNNRKPEYTEMVDKYQAKEYAKQLLNCDICVPTIALYESVNEIDIDKLPNSFVMKCTHDSHSVYVCKDSSKFDFDQVREEIRKALKRNYYWIGREYPYKDVKPRVIVEKYLEDPQQPNLLDYKFYMFSGQFKLLSITERRSKHEVYIDYYDRNFKSIELIWGYPNSGINRARPMQFEYMVSIAEKLSKGMPFLRVDFYEVSGRAYLGEMTFFDGSGFDEIKPHDWDVKMGEWILALTNDRK